MKELKPFATLSSLKKKLDNGGRFYDFFDSANDEKESRSHQADSIRRCPQGTQIPNQGATHSSRFFGGSLLDEALIEQHENKPTFT